MYLLLSCHLYRWVSRNDRWQTVRSIMARDLLLVIDMQNVYGPGGAWECPGSAAAGDKIKSLIDAVGDDTDVIFTKFIASDNPEGVWKNYNEENRQVNEDAYANEMMEDLKPYLNRYPVYIKSKYSSLTIPEVEEMAGRADRVIVTGVVAECCVLFTVMGLIDAGIPVIYLTDAVAGIDETTEAATVTVLTGLDPLHVRCMTSEEYLEERRKD